MSITKRNRRGPGPDPIFGEIWGYILLIEKLESVAEGSAEVEFVQVRDDDDAWTICTRVRARMVHRTGRGPVRVGCHGRSFDEALMGLSRLVDIENDKAAARAERSAR